MAKQRYKDKLSLRVSSIEMKLLPLDARLFPLNNFFSLSVEFAKALQFWNFRLKHVLTISTFSNASLKAAFTLISEPLFWSWNENWYPIGNQTARTWSRHDRRWQHQCYPADSIIVVSMLWRLRSNQWAARRMKQYIWGLQSSFIGCFECSLDQLRYNWNENSLQLDISSQFFSFLWRTNAWNKKMSALILWTKAELNTSRWFGTFYWGIA